tara:strand:+ start:155 stop:289 length:135 start_codon:yes stop_codon:yes gene_type:complete
MESLKILQSELKKLLPNNNTEEDKDTPKKIKKKSLFQLFKKPKY